MTQAKGDRLALRPAYELSRILVSTHQMRTDRATELNTLLDSVDPEALKAVAHRLRIERLLAHHAAALALSNRRAVQALDGSDRAAAIWGLLRRATTDLVASTLEQAGIECVPLKGAHLSRRLYGDDLVRESSDVDLLVPFSKLDAATRVLNGLGYELSGASHRGGRPRLHLVFLDPNGARPPVEVHWRVHWYETRFSHAVLTRSSVIDGIRVLRPADELAVLLLIYQRDGFVGLRLAADLAAFWDAVGSQATRTALRRIVSDHPALRRSLTASMVVAEETVGAIGARRHAEVGLDRRARFAVRMTNWRATSDVHQISADISLVDGLCTPRGDWAGFIRRAFVLDVPPSLPGSTDPPRSPGPWLVASHPFKTLARFMAAVVARVASRRPQGLAGGIDSPP